MAGKCSLESVKSGLVTVEDIIKMNALMERENTIKGFMEHEMSKKKPGK